MIFGEHCFSAQIGPNSSPLTESDCTAFPLLAENPIVTLHLPRGRNDSTGMRTFYNIGHAGDP
jgi:hypothetical protein